MAGDPYYRADLALVHDRGFGFHARACAPGILALLEPVLARGGRVVELGCGSGLLTEKLVAAGHRIIATDASPAMLDIAHARIGGRADVALLTLPDDPIPEADAIVAIGHPLNYVPDLESFERAVSAIGRAVRLGGVVAFDVCDLAWGDRDLTPVGRVGDDWALITEFSLPAPDRFVREITTFVADGDGRWRRDHERHENVLVDAARIPPLLAAEGVTSEVCDSFGAEELPAGLRAVVGGRLELPGV